MSLQLGADFPSRWLATPYAERRQCLRDLSSVCLLLDPNTDFDEWENPCKTTLMMSNPSRRTLKLRFKK